MTRDAAVVRVAHAMVRVVAVSVVEMVLMVLVFLPRTCYATSAPPLLGSSSSLFKRPEDERLGVYLERRPA
jgi:hypothetical protein